MLRVEKLCLDFTLRFRVQPSKTLKLALYYGARLGTMKWATSGYAFEIKVATLLDYSASEGWTLVGILDHFMPIVTRLQRGFVFHLACPLSYKFLSRLLINACSTINSLECCQGKFFRLCLTFFSLILNPKKVHLSLPAQNTVGMSLLEKYFNIESKSEIVWRTRSSIDLEDQTSQLEVIEQTGLQ